MQLWHSNKCLSKNVTDILSETHLAVLQPRNTRQVKNIWTMVQGNSDFHIMSIQSSWTSSEFTKICSLNSHIPDLVYICGSKQLFDEFDCTLILQSPARGSLINYHNTVVQLGDFVCLPWHFIAHYLKKTLLFLLHFFYMKESTRHVIKSFLLSVVS